MHIRPIDPENVRDAIALRVADGQQRFVAPVVQSLAEAYAEPHHAWPRLVYDDDTLVGFVMGGFHTTEPLFRSVIWRLNIAEGHQGRGYGRFAVRAVAREASARGLATLATFWVPGEDGPEGFYLKLGFMPTGVTLGDEVQGEAPVERLVALDPTIT